MEKFSEARRGKNVSFWVPIVLFLVFGFTDSANAWSPLVDTIWTITDSGGRVDWSHSGNNLIAFDRMGADSFYDVYLMNPDGSNIICLTDKPGLVPQKHNGQPAWHPSGEYIVFQSEKDVSFDTADQHWGPSVLSNPGIGWNCDLWCVTADGNSFYRLTNLRTKRTIIDPHPVTGVLHPHFSHDGTKLLWAECVDGLADTPGRGKWGLWRLNVADFIVDTSGPRIDTTNIRHYTPGDATFYESHDFSPNDSVILFSGNLQPGQHVNHIDIYTLNIYTDSLQRLTFTADSVWDEHAHYSSDGEKIVWMSSEGYPIDTCGAHWDTLRSDYWLMNVDGSNKVRLTYFNEPGHPEYTGERVVTADYSWSPGDSALVAYVIFWDSVSTACKEKIVMIEFAEPSVEERKSYYSESFYLSQNYPNPFTQKTVIEFKQGDTPCLQPQLEIYDLAGQLVKTFNHLTNQPFNRVIWDGRDDNKKLLTSGIYFVKLKVGEFSQTKKLLLFPAMSGSR